MMRKLTVPGMLAATLPLFLLLSGCAEMSDTQRRTATGGTLGAAGGAIIGSFSGNAGSGALIGAGVGALGGYLYDQNEKSREAAYRQGYQDAQSR
jgi:drug/metabolite transporter (DMT)-like permease